MYVYICMYNTLQHTATHQSSLVENILGQSNNNTLEHTAKHRNSQQHIVTHKKSLHRNTTHLWLILKTYDVYDIFI